MAEHWEIGKLELKAGQILVVRYSPPPDEHHFTTAANLKAAGEAVRGAIDVAGLKGKVPVLLITDRFDITAICPLEFMDICVTAKDQEKKEGNQ